jgi:hypothetical protein
VDKSGDRFLFSIKLSAPLAAVVGVFNSIWRLLSPTIRSHCSKSIGNSTTFFAEKKAKDNEICKQIARIK